MRRIMLGVATCALASVWPAIASADNKEFSQGVAGMLRDSGRMVDYNIGVTTKGDVVYLEGRVASKEQAAEAVHMTSELPGVSKVVNRLHVKPSAPKKTATVKQDAEAAAAQMAAEAQTAVEEGMTAVRKTIFPDPSLPAQAPVAAQAKATKRAPKGVAKRPAGGTQKAYNVQQVSQNVPHSFTPSDSAQMMPPQMPAMPQQQRMAMAPLGVAAGAAGAAMGQCPPGAMGGPGGYAGGPGGYGGGAGGPMPMSVPSVSGGVAPARYDQPHMPNYAWPSYAAYPNYAQVAYPRQYSPTAWPYIGPFYPYPQVPLGWRKVMLEWDDGWWMLNFKQ